GAAQATATPAATAETAPRAPAGRAAADGRAATARRGGATAGSPGACRRPAAVAERAVRFPARDAAASGTRQTLPARRATAARAGHRLPALPDGPHRPGAVGGDRPELRFSRSRRRGARHDPARPAAAADTAGDRAGATR